MGPRGFRRAERARPNALQTASTYNDGQRHQVVGTPLGPNGMNLYVDGGERRQPDRRDQRAGTKRFWRVCGDMLNGWPSAPTSRYCNGTIDEVSNYPTVLTATQVRGQYVVGTTGAAAAAPAIAPDGVVCADPAPHAAVSSDGAPDAAVAPDATGATP